MLWRKEQGWLWTGQGLYRYLYRHSDSGWYLYMRKIDDHLLLYRYATSEWVDFEVK
mgnify:CR=1 FL=1